MSKKEVLKFQKDYFTKYINDIVLAPQKVGQNYS